MPLKKPVDNPFRQLYEFSWRSKATGSLQHMPYWDDMTREQVASDLFVSAANFFALNFADPGFLIEQLLPDEGITILGGDPSAGKSWVAYELIRAALTGTPWMGRSAPAADGIGINCALINFDQPSRELKRRLIRLGVVPSEHLFLHTIGVRGRPIADDIALKLPKAVPALINLFQHRSIKLAVFDSMRQSHEQDENDSTAMAEVMNAFRTVSASCKCLIVLIQHFSKGREVIRGSGEIEAALDTAITMRGAKVKGVLNGTMTWRKTRQWVMNSEKDRFKFSISDDGDRTLVRFIEPVPGIESVEVALSLVIAALANGPLEPEEIKVALEKQLNRHEIARAVRLGKQQGKIESARLGANGNGRRIALAQ